MTSYTIILKGSKYFAEGRVRETHRTEQYAFYTLDTGKEEHYLTLNKRKDLLTCTCKHGSLVGAARGDLCSHKIATILYINQHLPFKKKKL